MNRRLSLSVSQALNLALKTADILVLQEKNAIFTSQLHSVLQNALSKFLEILASKI